MPLPTTSARTAGRWSERARLAAQALVLALVVSGTSAFAVLHKTVTLDVDGTTTTVSAFGRTVGDVLAAQDVTVAEGDLVVPGLGETVADDAEIVVRRGREVVVEIDGERQSVWTTALTVGDVLAELDVRGARASASRSATLGRDVLRLSTAKTVHVVDGESTTAVLTSASTVREALGEAGVVLGPHDRVSVSLDAPAVDGLMVVVTRVAAVTRSETTTQPFETVREEDPRLLEGSEVVRSEGRDGVRTVTFVAYEVGGVEVGRDMLAEMVLSEASDRVVRVGTMTMPDPVAVPAVEPGTARAIGLAMTLERGWGEDQFACLDQLWTKESGWRVNAANASSGAYGIPQSLPGSKMASAGADWQTNPATQIAWGLGYIGGRYGTPCDAWAHSQARNWY
ncbi:ubiquitin-like domain-containing protein [Actinotalea sp. K2]|uniref:aggregation-promoting factor C-terminal-like domain-containing protein n=1 Tax=Actinotalea sp. K2 TaxID=2939438 RepID=UPI002017181A|nr:ubiquitin-like domain-containing protein [Actinotalea sp. K2]MCL3861266.1 ubiquitin-like domain-containing protein [Actinotalea sp. K2]